LDRCDGFTSHPYGVVGGNSGNDLGEGAFEKQAAKAAALGFANADYFYITETGYRSLATCGC
jgi:hypothetical protein